MRPHNLKTRIFLDGGNPEDTKAVLKQIGFLDGQTTNPTLIAKNPEARKRLEQGDKFSKDEIFTFYHGVVNTISGLMPQGSISIEVYADAATPAGEMLKQGKEMFTWIPNAHIKFPTSREGLKAAQQAVKAGLRVNMTLVFTQEQAAAVYAATQGREKGQVFLSPFIGRLDDQRRKRHGPHRQYPQDVPEGRRPRGGADSQRQDFRPFPVCAQARLRHHHRAV